MSPKELLDPREQHEFDRVGMGSYVVWKGIPHLIVSKNSGALLLVDMVDGSRDDCANREGGKVKNLAYMTAPEALVVLGRAYLEGELINRVEAAQMLERRGVEK